MQEVEVKAGATTSVEFSYTGTEKPGAAAGLPMKDVVISQLAIGD
jgi:hypothetical protein